MPALLITGTDTDAGKTVLTSALAAYWQHYFPHRSLGILKPIQSGVGDREHYAKLFQRTLEEVNPLHFAAPLAPPVAAQKEGKRVELAGVWRAFQQLVRQKDFVLVEGLGGLGSPVTEELTVADLARDWGLPSVLVAPVKLGAIGHTVANVALAQQAKVKLSGIVLNCSQPLSTEEQEDLMPVDLIQGLTHLPVLGTIPYLDNLSDLDKLTHVASQLELEQIFPSNFT